ncbi:MAG TPA: helix-turn-helix domain-containing protein [Candidatus Sulfomarinibacteraceae bacterium]|nr:helix-turn-helix domain-containing protein [Candidatus Sulfomarinibacteraceae bacterium]
MEIGQRIRQRRKQLGLSLRDLAAEVGLTASFISQVERNLASPSIDSLRAIAKALDEPLFFFLLEPDEEERVIRRDQRRKLISSDPAVTYELLTPLNKKMEVVLTKLEPGDGSIPIIHHQDTEECIYVLEGQLEVGLVDQTYTLNGGDSIYFEGPMLRSLAAHGNGVVKYLVIVTPPIL